MPLKIALHSFSYLNSGIPKDQTGNGGGFVFDCRFINNPGRLEEFKSQTGKDTSVINYLNEDNAMQEFLAEVNSILTKAIMNYLNRKFSHLMVCFGCTGGQHRSVYSVEKTKEFILKHFPEVRVEVIHNEFPELNNT